MGWAPPTMRANACLHADQTRRHIRKPRPKMLRPMVQPNSASACWNADIAVEDVEALRMLPMQVEAERELALEIVLHEREGAAGIRACDLHERIVARPVVIRPASRRHEPVSFHCLIPCLVKGSYLILRIIRNRRRHARHQGQRISQARAQVQGPRATRTSDRHPAWTGLRRSACG